MERGCVGKVRRDRPELCESSTESRRPGTRRPVELITREMGTPAEERAGKEVLGVGMVGARIGSGASPPAPAWTAALESIPSVETLTSC